MRFVCPKPPIWSDIYLRLKGEWERSGCEADPPPVPLILNGWIASSDVEKKQRWEQLISWASDRGYDGLVPQLAAENQYRVAELSTASPAYDVPHHYKPWDCEEKNRPSDAVAEKKLTELKEEWPAIAGPEVSAHTKPIAFSGDKLRCLHIRADTPYQPPWGTWDTLYDDERRRHFTRLRAAVNEHLKPMMVDHIVFEKGG